AVMMLGDHGQNPRHELAWICPPSNNVHYGWTSAMEGARDELQETLRRVLDCGKPETLHDVTVKFPPAADTGTVVGEKKSDPFHPQEGPPRGVFLLPFRARGLIFGALSRPGGTAGRPVPLPDPAGAAVLPGRPATALDTARLYRDVREADRLKNEF